MDPDSPLVALGNAGPGVVPLRIDVPRLRGLTELVRELVPDVLVPAFVLVTNLGDVAFFLLVLSLLYWFEDRERAAYLVAITMGGLAFGLALKYVFALPRPSQEAFVVYAEGYGFPSGHALASTIFFGSLAIVHDVSRWEVRATAAAAIVLLVALSRVVLGVHYVADGIAGIVLGACYLVGVVAVTGGDTRYAYWIAALAGLAALVATGGNVEGAAIAGATVGGALAWEAVARAVPHRSPELDVAIALVALPLVGAFAYLSVEVATSPPVSFVGGVLLSASVLGLPAVAERYFGGAGERRHVEP